MTVEEFMSAANLKDVFSASVTAGGKTRSGHQFSVAPISSVEAEKARKMTAENFVTKCEWFSRCGNLTAADLVDVFRDWWDVLVMYSFVVVDESGELRAVALAADQADLLKVTTKKIHPHFLKIFRMLRSFTHPVIKEYNPCDLSSECRPTRDYLQKLCAVLP